MLGQRLTRLSQPLARTCLLPIPCRTISTTPVRRAATHDDGHHGHDSHYDPPGGWLWGIRPGEKAEKEGWEGPFYYLFCGGLVAATIAYCLKEDTSIQTWALEEARRRLEKEGILEDPNPSV